jgi:hypothetical protein
VTIEADVVIRHARDERDVATIAQRIAMQCRAATSAATSTGTGRARLEEVDHPSGADSEIRVRALRNARHRENSML